MFFFIFLEDEYEVIKISCGTLGAYWRHSGCVSIEMELLMKTICRVQRLSRVELLGLDDERGRDWANTLKTKWWLSRPFAATTSMDF